MKTKAHLVFPQDILKEVDQIAGKRKRSLFIVEATQEKLEKVRFLKSLDETKGIWTDKQHADLKTGKQMERYVRDKRESYGKRFKRTVND